VGFQDPNLEIFWTWFSGHGILSFGDLEFALRVSKTQKHLGNFRIWFSEHDFQDLGSQLWSLDFHTRGFQDRNLKTFRMWFSRCGISILAHDFQDMDGEPCDFTVSEQAPTSWIYGTCFMEGSIKPLAQFKCIDKWFWQNIERKLEQN
jgi:hypothetical protein